MPHQFYQKIKLSLLCLSLLVLSTCQVPDDYGDLTLLILDNSGLPVSDAQVSIYSSETDYLNESNALFESVFTNSEGVIDFFDLTLDTCFIDIQKTDLNNWEGKSQIGLIKTENGYNNFEVFVIFESRTGVVANASGKTWRRTSLTFNGENITDNLLNCELDNEFIFYKNQNLQVSEGASQCDASDPSVVDYTWRFNDNNTTFIINDGTTTEEWIIVNISQNQLRVQQDISTEVGNFVNVEVIYESI